MKNKLALSLLASTLFSGTLLAGLPAASAASQSGVVQKSVNFREEPSTSGERIRYLKAGEHVSLLGKVNKYWYKVKDRSGTIGYVTTQSQFIDTSGSAQAMDKHVQAAAAGTPSRVIQAGMKYLGTPYEFGSSRSNTHTFDCSDFVRQAFKDGAGIILPADSRKQADYVKRKGHTTTNWKNLKPGDIMFFMSYKGSKSGNYAGIDKSKQRITHNGIYLGNGKILQTYSKESGGVRIDSIVGKHWEYRFVFGGSAL
ncbi:C40 family peptidase [Paenibacillus humicola]|uniref:C40 family peptidase n=1 Tax=Paenibacillus humicola TaxID=3110540 RepID=UPI00237A6C66|nr:SH3 domain-containing C40 family peptidase [Paenibacillus humicola]